MQKLMLTYCLVFLCSLSLFSQGQQETQQKPQTALDAGNIQSQFNYLLKKSKTWNKKHKLVNIERMEKFGSNVQDSLILLHEKLTISVEKTKQLEAEIGNRETKIQNLEVTVEACDQISFLGIDFSKSSYNLLMCILILGSFSVAGICFVLLKRNNAVTTETKRKLKNLKKEFEEHRQNALIKEQKLARRLQDEVIKNKTDGL